MKKRRIIDCLKIWTLGFGVLLLFANCENEGETINESNKQNEFIINHYHLNDLNSNLIVQNSLKKINAKKSKHKHSSKSSYEQDLYNFTVDSSNVKEVVKDNYKSYTFFIKRPFDTPDYFENLIIEEREQENINAFIIKYIPSSPIETFEEHNSFYFEGERIIQRLNLDKLDLAYKEGCYTVAETWCSWSFPHVAGPSCYLATDDRLYLKLVEECIDEPDLGGVGGGDGSTDNGGSDPIITSPTDSDGNPVEFFPEEIQANQLNELLDFSLSKSELDWLKRNPNEGISILSLLIDNNTSQTKKFSEEAIEFLAINTQYSFEQYENWFSPFNAELETNPTVVNPDDITFDTPLTQQALPTFTTFLTNFQKRGTSGNYSPMSTTDAYTLAGGSLLNSHINQNPQYNNACAIRASRGLLYSGIQIPVLKYNGLQRTQKGADGKNYILDAVSFNTYMVAKFGETSAKLEGTDANDPVKVAALLNGKNGIYVIVNSNTITAGYSGHCDVIINGKCISAAYTNPSGGVKSIRIWELN